jgi:hypothetical protein
LKVPETKDLLAQQALLAECQLFYASEKEKNSTDEFWIKKENGDVNHIKYLTPESTPTIDEFRRIVLTLEAAKVRPFMGKNYLALVSPAVYFDLITDDRVKEFMKYSQTGAPYVNDSVVDLFSLAFRKAKTIKTDNTFTAADGLVKYLYHVSAFTGTISTIPHAAKRANVITTKKWEDVAGGDNITVVPLVKTGSVYAAEGTVTKTAFLAMTTPSAIDVLNVHYSYVLGEEALFEISIEGHGTPQFISKPLGSAGTADPLNQRQSIGWKLDSIGYKVANPDAVQAYLSIPTQYRVNVNARPDLKNQFTEYDYGYVAADGKYYHPAQVIQTVIWDAVGEANKVVYLVKGTQTEVLPQSLTKLITPVKPGRIDAAGKNMVVKGRVPTLEFALKTNVAVQFDEDQVVQSETAGATFGKFYINGLVDVESAEVVALPQTATTTEVLGDGTGTETRTSLFVKENIED